MKHGWKTRIDERRYFEEKLAARKARIAKAAIGQLKEIDPRELMFKRKEPFLNRFISIDPNEQKEMIHGKQWL